MKKIGILLNSNHCNQYIYNMVGELSKSNRIELFFLLNRSNTTQQGLLRRICCTIKAKGMFRFVDLAIFMLITNVECKCISIFFPENNAYRKLLSIEEFNKNDTIYLSPIFSKL